MAQGIETIHIVDDDIVVCEVIAQILETQGLLVEKHNDAQAFLMTLATAPVGCVHLDIDMPEMNGLQVQQALRRLQPSIPVIFVSGTTNIREAIDGLKGGAMDLIQKPPRPAELLRAVAAALGKARTHRRQQMHCEHAKAQLALLTARERQVLECLISGASNKATAAILRISERTVEVHRSRVLRKLNAKSATEAVRIALLAEPQLIGSGDLTLTAASKVRAITGKV